MASVVAPNEDLQLRIAEALEQIQISIGPLGICDTAMRQRVTIDAIAPSLTLGAITTVSTVTSVTNMAAIAGEGVRQFEPIMNTNFQLGILNQLTFN